MGHGHNVLWVRHCIIAPRTACWFILAVCLGFLRQTKDAGQASKQNTLTLALPDSQVRQAGLLEIRIISPLRSVSEETGQQKVYSGYITGPDCGDGIWSRKLNVFLHLWEVLKNVHCSNIYLGFLNYFQ